MGKRRTLALCCGAACATIFLAQGAIAESGAGAAHASVFDRHVPFEPDALRVECDEAVTPAEATAQIDAGASDALRIHYRLPENTNAIYVRAATFTANDLPEIPWGAGFRIERLPQGVTVTLFATDRGGELWEYVMPRIAPWESGDTRQVEIPFTWFELVPWERRDGTFDPATLETLSFRLTNADPQQPREGEVLVEQFVLRDARRPVAASNADGFAILDLDKVLNSDGVAYRDAPLDGDFHTGDWQHRALPAEQFPTTGVATLAGIPFSVPDVADGRDNHVRCNGQRLTGFNPGQFSALYALATGKFGKQMGDVALRYSDGSSDRVMLEVSDWTDGPTVGDVVAVSFSETYHGDEIEDRQPKLYVQSIRIDAAKILESIELPHNDFLKIFALSLSTEADPPSVAALQSQRLEAAHPRFAMKTLDRLDFSSAPRGAGVYGGHVARTAGRYSVEESWTNGSLAFTLDVEHLRSRLPRMPLVWTGCLGENRPLVLGQFAFPGAAFNTIQSSILDWTCIQYDVHSASSNRASLDVMLSRAWPALGVEASLSTVHWQLGDGHGEAWAAVATDDGIVTRDATMDALPEMTEPWLLTWTHSPGLDFVVPMLVVLQNRPERVAFHRLPDLGSTLALQFPHGAGGMCAMPLYGISRISLHDATAWTRDGLPSEVVTRCREWARRLQRFPVGIRESYRASDDTGALTIETHWAFRGWNSEWEIELDPVALIPPVMTLAQNNNYPSTTLSKVVDCTYDTFWGPAALVAGDMTEVTLSLPRYVASAPIPARVTGAPLFDTITDALGDAIDAAIPASLESHRYASTGDEAQLRVLAPSYLTLDDTPKRLGAYVHGIAENMLKPNNLKVEKEPITGQFYLMDDRFWAKDETFDKEWQIGYMFQGLWNYAYYGDDTEFLKTHWDKIRGLYAYYRIVFDWATCSTFTMAHGFNANSDGIRIAWEGMLAMARMAATVGDRTTYDDAMARASKQMLSLYASWFAPQWAAMHDYAMVQYRPASPDETEQRFAPDNSWTEFVTCNLSHPTDFFQTTHAFYFYNLSHLAFFHDSGIGERFLRPWLEEVVPALHPAWCDGNVFSEASGQYYGGGHTMAHLVTRALVIGDDTEQLYECYRRSIEDTHVSTQWYKPQSVAGETLTALLMGAAPIVYAPVLESNVLENSYDHAAKRQRIRLRGKSNTNAAVHVRTGLLNVATLRVNDTERNVVIDAATGDLEIAVALEEGRDTLIDITYS